MALSGSFFDHFMELVQNSETQERLLDASRQIFTSSNITVNLLPALLLGGLLLLALPLLFSGHGGSDTGTNYQVYGTTGASYGAPSSGYGAPSSSYAAPSSSYAAPSSSYGSRSNYDYPVEDGYAEYRALVDSQSHPASVPHKNEFAKRLEEVAIPAVSRLAQAAANLIN